MENHPIPQDVTGFKFKLIGSVTIKQFLYLLGFGILTTVAFILPVNIILKIPMMLLFAGIGVSLAFVPIEGRPMDVMLVNFAKAIPSENRYAYRKRGVNLAAFQAFSITSQAQLAAQTEEKAINPQDEKKAILLSRLRNSPFRPEEDELAVLANVKSFYEEEPKPAIAHVAVATPVQEKEEARPVQIPVQQVEQPSSQSQADVPNVILGNIKDSRGKPLQNILVEVVDSNDVSVRAFKTNALGRFAAATPLQNGSYKIRFEDPAKTHEFETLEITLNDQILNPFEITSVDAREKLRRELFDAQSAGA